MNKIYLIMKKIFSAGSPCFPRKESYGIMSRSRHKLRSFFIFGAQLPKNCDLFMKFCFSANFLRVGACKQRA